MENENLICPICGDPTNVYMGKARKDRLCKKHGKMRNDKLIDINEEGLFFEIATGALLNPPAKASKKVEEPKHEAKNGADELTCIICGEPSNSKHFCIKCYQKYKDRSIDIRITNCRDTQIIDEYGNKTKKAKDGRKVRSLSEKIIIDFFFDNFIRVVYEKTIPYTNEKGESAELHPDFYLPDYDLYIEFNGLTNKSYLKMKNYVNKIYQEKGYKVEILESQDLDDIEGTLGKILERYKK